MMPNLEDWPLVHPPTPVPEDVFGSNEGTLVGTADWDTASAAARPMACCWMAVGYVSLGTVPSFDFSSDEGTVEGWIRADERRQSDTRLLQWRGKFLVRSSRRRGHELAPCRDGFYKRDGQFLCGR